MKNLSWLILLCTATLLGCGSSEDNNPQAVQDPSGLKPAKHAIVNGVADKTAAHRAVVSLYDTSSDMSLCTGTLIAPNWVLTASHCVREDDGAMSDHVPSLKIGIGNDESELSKNLYEIEEVIGHEDYYCPIWCYGKKNDTPDSDIALIKLKDAVPESVAKPILPLPPERGITRKAIQKGLSAEYVGFGYDENWNAGKKLHIVDNMTGHCGASDNDKGKYCYHEKWGEFPWGTIFFENVKGGLCNGDSGGPALVRIDGKEYVAGVSSYVLSDCRTYSVSTSVQDYYDWIVKHVPEITSQYHFESDNNYTFDTIYLESSTEPEVHTETCDDSVSEMCVAQYGAGTACIEDSGDLYCSDICNNENEIQERCVYNEEMGQYITSHDECVHSYGNVYVYWTTSFDVCDNGCDATGDKCKESKQETPEKEEDQDYSTEITECNDEITQACIDSYHEDLVCVKDNGEFYCGDKCDEIGETIECVYLPENEKYVVLRHKCTNSYDNHLAMIDYVEETCHYGCNQAGDACAQSPDEAGDSQETLSIDWDKTDNLNGIGKARSYGDRSFVSTDTNIKWQYRTGRPISGDSAIDGDSLILRGDDSDNGNYITSEDIILTKNSIIGADISWIYSSKKERIVTIEYMAYDPASQSMVWKTCSQDTIPDEALYSVTCQFPRDPGKDWRIRVEGGQMLIDNISWKR